MSGVVEKRAVGKDGIDSWRIRVYAGRENGRVRWVSRTVHGTKRAAQKELANLVREVEHGQVSTCHPISLEELVERWLADIRPHRSAYTLKEYGRIFEANIRPALGSVKLEKLVKEPERIDAFYRHLTSARTGHSFCPPAPRAPPRVVGPSREMGHDPVQSGRSSDATEVAAADNFSSRCHRCAAPDLCGRDAWGFRFGHGDSSRRSHWMPTWGALRASLERCRLAGTCPAGFEVPNGHQN